MSEEFNEVDSEVVDLLAVAMFFEYSSYVAAVILGVAIPSVITFFVFLCVGLYLHWFYGYEKNYLSEMRSKNGLETAEVTGP